MSTNHSNNTKKFITAGSLRGLHRNMRKLDLRFGAGHIFDSIGNYVDDKGKNVFYAWYLPTTQEVFKETEEIVNGD